MWWIRDVVKCLLQVLSCHQPQWRPIIARTLVGMCIGFVWQGFGSRGATGMASLPIEPVPASSKGDLPQLHTAYRIMVVKCFHPTHFPIGIRSYVVLTGEKCVLHSNTEVCLMTSKTAIWVRLSSRNPDSIYQKCLLDKDFSPTQQQPGKLLTLERVK